ncbi:MAG: sodium:solute symporter family protein [Firmicutes bacterium]|nr:sodium:solute symporter family protein [Bacillota bacterium]
MGGDINIPLLAICLLIFIGAVTYLTYLGSLQTKSQEDYMVAGRQIPGWVMALSYASTFISTSAIVGFGGAAGVFGFSLMWLSFLNIFVGIFFAFVFMGAPIRSMSSNLGANTLASFLGARYQSGFITTFTGLMIFLFMPAYTGVVLIGGARFIQGSLQIDYNLALLLLVVLVALYVGWGGMRGVMYADAFMCVMMLIGMVLLLFTTYSIVGGVVAGHQALTDLANKVPEKMAAAGHLGWTSMPAGGSPYWWVVVSTIVMGVGIGVLAQPQLALRFMTVPSKMALNRAVVTGGICIFFFTGTAFMVGPLSNVFFHETTGKIAIAAAQGNIDLIIPTFINAMMPQAYIYLFMITLISACLTTMLGLIHVQSIAFSRDMLPKWGFKTTRSPLFYSRIGVVIGATAAVVMAYILPISIIARATAFWFGICAAGILPALLGAIFWRRATKKAAIWSVALGYGVSILGFVFLHAAESKPLGISKLLFGKDALLPYPWTVVDPLFYSITISTIALIAISYFTPQFSKDHIDKCFSGVGRQSSSSGKEMKA